MSDPYRTLLRPLVTGQGAYAGHTAEAAEAALNAATVATSGNAMLAAEAFIARFTPSEYVAAEDSADPVIRHLMARLRARDTPLDLTSATVQGGLAYMVSLGLITADRAAAIGAVPAGANITPRQAIGWPHERIWAADVIAAREMED